MPVDVVLRDMTRRDILQKENFSELKFPFYSKVPTGSTACKKSFTLPLLWSEEVLNHIGYCKQRLKSEICLTMVICLESGHNGLLRIQIHIIEIFPILKQLVLPSVPRIRAFILLVLSGSKLLRLQQDATEFH